MKFFTIWLIAFLSASSNLYATEQFISAGGNYVVYLENDLSESKIGHYLSVELAVTDSSGERLSKANITIDGGMPGHGHGLPTSPIISEVEDGIYVINGLKFTMPGLWQIVLLIEKSGMTDVTVLKFSLQ